MKLLKDKIDPWPIYGYYKYCYKSPIYLHVEDLVEEGYYATAMLAEILFPYEYRL